jgi:sulfatase modifying factor 1
VAAAVAAALGGATCGSAVAVSSPTGGAAVVVDGGGGVAGVSEAIIPAGTYTLGTKDVVFVADAEGPEYKWTAPQAFAIDVYEVSNARLQEWVAATGAVTEAEVFGSSFVHENANISAAVLAATTSAVAAAPWWIQVCVAVLHV